MPYSLFTRRRSHVMLKKIGILATGLFIGASALFADDQMQPAMDNTNLYSGGFVVGPGLTTLQSAPLFGGNAGAIFQWGYYSSCWMFDIGASFAGDLKLKHTVTTFLGHLGPRNRLCGNLFISYGAMGLGHALSKGKSNQWSAGAFTGLDYQFSKHFMLSGKIYPYNYERRLSRYTHNIFANGTISLFYVF